MSYISRGRLVALLAAAALAGGPLQAAVEVNSFEPASLTTTPDVWYASDVRAAGTASIVDLTGVGGDLETNQPLPTGAALLTTGFSNDDKAEVATYNDFGDAATLLNSATVAYSYHKATVAGGNAAAAPSIKLGIYAAGGTGDNYGQLVYEPYLNVPGNPTADAWQDVTVLSDSGLWWWTGGFELPNGAGGPPYRTLADWAVALATADAVDFAAARVVSIAVGVGTYNQGQAGYFDDVMLSSDTGVDVMYDFQAASGGVIPEPSLALCLAGCLTSLGLMTTRRRG
ncbi:hypothetical protein Mal64_17350 [Pseudobythopirellula maris]|uniref:PEP-CTERM protein-sorting domain-containing protein n=1 Tax=Pseudobythopirellula maris TaxID=2527991 RepID=A0A5C5ZMD1_9BACT|nr:hypothetical protein [Pseudobythopirellula maris]TWT88256.1 hypothetical protein Mal64_17350 [Pseudobythopirellula maris]